MQYQINSLEDLAKTFDQFSASARHTLSLIRSIRGKAMLEAEANTWTAAADIVRNTRIVPLTPPIKHDC